MPRYIDVEREIKEIESVLDEKRAKGDDEDNIGFYALMMFTRKLRKAPTADVAPVVHAHWIPIKKRMYACRDKVGEIITVSFTCSNCGITEENEWTHCHCGATMDNGTCSPVRLQAERELKEQLKSILSQAFVNCNDNYGMPNSLEVAEYLIDHDIVVKKKAHWIERERVTKSAARRRTIHSILLSCSNCGESNGRHRNNYCQHCGAKMDEEKSDD